MSLKIAIVPGSFDPITYGHVDIVKRAQKDYDVVYLAVMINASKEYMFTLEQREKIAKAALAECENVKVISSDGMLWELALKLDACAIIKGYRNECDLKYELEMAEFNKAHNPKAETILLKSDEALSDLSSTKVRNMILNNEDISEYIPRNAIEEIYKIKSNNS